MIFQTVLESRCSRRQRRAEFPASQQQREVPRTMAAITPTGSRTIIASSWLRWSPLRHTLCRSLRRTSEWRRRAGNIISQTVTNRFAGVESSSSASSSALASIKSASLFSTLYVLPEKRVTSRRVQIRRVCAHRTVDIDALAACNIRQRCWVTGSTVSKVSFSAAAVYSR